MYLSPNVFLFKVRRLQRNHSSDAAPKATTSGVSEEATLSHVGQMYSPRLLKRHGHTHRPDVHTVDLGNRKAKRIVLGDWYTQGSVVRWDMRGPKLQTLPR